MNYEAKSNDAGKGRLPPATILMLLTNAYDPDPRVRQEALALIAMGCRARLLAWDRDLKSPAFECLEGVEVERVYLPSRHGRGSTQLFFYAWLYLKMLWRAWRIPFDAVHCHDLDTVPLGFVVGKLKHKPIIYDAHESFTDMLEGSVHPLLKRSLLHLENFFLRRIDLLITVGEKLRRYFSDRGASRTAVVGNWKRPEDYSIGPDQRLQLRRRLGIPDDAFTVVFITNLLKDRKIEELLQAVDETPDVYLLIGGKGVLEEMVRARAAKNPRVIYVGFVPAQQVPAYTCAADVIYYGFDPTNPNARFSAPNKLFEALAAAMPLITGDFGEIGEVVRRGSCGIILPAYSPAAIRASLEALMDRDLRNKYARNAALLGQKEMNGNRCQDILYREYSALLRTGKQPRAAVRDASSESEEALEAIGAGRNP